RELLRNEKNEQDELERERKRNFGVVAGIVPQMQPCILDGTRRHDGRRGHFGGPYLSGHLTRRKLVAMESDCGATDCCPPRLKKALRGRTSPSNHSDVSRQCTSTRSVRLMSHGRDNERRTAGQPPNARWSHPRHSVCLTAGGPLLKIAFRWIP